MSWAFWGSVLAIITFIFWLLWRYAERIERLEQEEQQWVVYLAWLWQNDPQQAWLQQQVFEDRFHLR